MPYKVIARGDKFAVVNKDTGHVELEHVAIEFEFAARAGKSKCPFDAVAAIAQSGGERLSAAVAPDS